MPEGLDAAGVEKWEIESLKAADCIVLTIDESIIIRLDRRDFVGAHQLMTRLAALFGLSELIRLTKKLCTTKLSEFRNVTEFSARLKSLNKQITDTGIEMTGDTTVLVAFSIGLSKNYQHLVQQWALIPNITTDKALTILSTEERRIEQAEKEKEASKCAYTAVDRKRSHSDMRATAGDYCPRSKKPHKPEECWRLHPELAPDWLNVKRAKES